MAAVIMVANVAHTARQGWTAIEVAARGPAVHRPVAHGFTQERLHAPSRPSRMRDYDKPNKLFEGIRNGLRSDSS